jgi:hypothetical protein
MTTTIQSEYRNLPLDSLTESNMNPRRSFDEAALTELADFVPRHKIGLLFRSSFCCRGRGESRGHGRLPLVRGT